jgi:glycosyltransferase involved in cell wall biosynthesis
MDQLQEERPSLAILGIRGVPGAHGGFETFTTRLAPFLAQLGWDVRVYCQECAADDAETGAKGTWTSSWEGVTRVHIAVARDSAIQSVRFDWLCVSHVIEKRPDAVLMLGYNTAVFAARLRSAGIPTVINMDGIEWRREKWGPIERAWLYINERAACSLAQHLIADHPEISRHLQSRTAAGRITVIPYGSDLIDRRFEATLTEQHRLLEGIGLDPQRFATLIARPEPENSILEMVRAFSATKRGVQLVVLGNYYFDRVRYHAAVKAAASAEVVFPGAIYDRDTVDALRRHSLFYLHGHQVGGCNPSLLEAMGAGNAVIAHDNPFNRWVVRDGAAYFGDSARCAELITEYLADPAQRARRAELNRRRAADVFNWDDVLQSYTHLLLMVSRSASRLADPEWNPRSPWTLDTP